MKHAAIFGMGYVGCVTAACLSRDGHRVVGVDIDCDKVAAVNAGQPPISEVGLEALLRSAVGGGDLSATGDVEQAVRETEIGLVTVGTPSLSAGDVSIQAVERVIREIGVALRGAPHAYTLVVRSTLLPGILEEQLIPQLSEASGRNVGPKLRVCNNPEFLREGSAVRDYDHPPYVLIGTVDDWDAQEVRQLYHSVQAEQIVTDSRTAALVKYACNAYHALKITFANEIGSVAKSLGADGQSVMDLVCRDTKLNVSKAYLRPGFAFGGSCLPKDVRALKRYAEREGLGLGLLGSILPSNQEHLQRAIDLVEANGRRNVGLLGLSFKAGTDDLRESPYVTLVQTLLGHGYKIKIYDPGISISRLRGRNLAYIDQRLPHLASLLVEAPAELYEHAELLLLGNDIADELSWKTDYCGDVIDLRQDLVVARGLAGGAMAESVVLNGDPRSRT